MTGLGSRQFRRLHSRSRRDRDRHRTKRSIDRGNFREQGRLVRGAFTDRRGLLPDEQPSKAERDAKHKHQTEEEPGVQALGGFLGLRLHLTDIGRQGDCGISGRGLETWSARKLRRRRHGADRARHDRDLVVRSRQPTLRTRDHGHWMPSLGHQSGVRSWAR